MKQLEINQQHHHHSTSSSSSSSKLIRRRTVRRDAALSLRHQEESTLRKSSASSETMASSTSSSSRRANAITSLLPGRQQHQQHQQLMETCSTSSLSHSSSSSQHFLKNQQASANQFLNASGSLFTSPDVHSLVQQIGTDFADLENAISTKSLLINSSSSQSSNLTSAAELSSTNLPSLSARLFSEPLRFSRRALSPTSRELAIEPAPLDYQRSSQTSSDGADQQPVRLREPDELPLSVRGAKIRELLDKAQHYGDRANSDAPLERQQSVGEPVATAETPRTSQADSKASHLDHCEAVKNEIERIDQRMSDLCKKLEQCETTDEAIDLLKIMVQMIEKAWSVPVCGDDLGFKLCNSLRHAGGLDIILGFINEAEADDQWSSVDSSDEPQTSDSSATTAAGRSRKTSARLGIAPLRLNLTKLNHDQVPAGELHHQGDELQQRQLQKRPIDSGSQSATSTRDYDSDILTSDLGLDSTSVESLTYVSASQSAPVVETLIDGKEPSESTEILAGSQTLDKGTALSESAPVSATHNQADSPATEGDGASKPNKADQAESEAKARKARKEELVFLSSRLLSQCLTSENRDYIVKLDLEHVIRLACIFITVKSIQKRSRRLLSQTPLRIRRANSETGGRRVARESLGAVDDLVVKSRSSTVDLGDEFASARSSTTATATTARPPLEAGNKERAQMLAQKQQLQLASDIHSAIGTEILQHLFKHSEETCSSMISLGALQAILYGCRSSNVETLRHCAMALANLALYGGSDGQQTMIEHKAHVWLFPLAFHEDDNVQYYACLAIVVLAANQEIEADVLKSGTLELVEPFVASHEPRKFAESTTAHVHGQSAGWLRKLVPLLESKREEARNLACFHFAMEAHIKREQGQTQVFREIGAVESLRRAGSLPIAMASKFARQALRLIGEKEPHKLSQQVPLWTIEDVCVWVGQIGFDRFTAAFRDSHVDGDLLLQLHDETLRFDIGIENGIIRRRFLRELGNLKRIADYSSVDRLGLISLLAGTNSLSSLSSMGASASSISHHQSSSITSARDYLQYIYPILRMGVTRDNIHLVDCDQLLAECKISNTIHRVKLAQAIRELQERVLTEAASMEQDQMTGSEQKTLDCFVSYRRSTGSQLASLLKVHLQLRGFSVFIDVERLEAGNFDYNLLDSIKSAKNFILVLSQNALDRCIGDTDCKDWVHKEIVAALASKCNIIPIMDNFQWPDAEQLPEDMRSIPSFNSVRWIHDYQDACVDKLERFIRGDWPGAAFGGAQQQQQQQPQQQQQQQQQQQLSGSIAGSINLISTGAGGGQNSLQRASASTPSVVATPSLGGPPLRAHPAPHPSESDKHPLAFATGNGYLLNHHLHHHQLACHYHNPNSPCMANHARRG